MTATKRMSENQFYKAFYVISDYEFKCFSLTYKPYDVNIDHIISGITPSILDHTCPLEKELNVYNICFFKSINFLTFWLFPFPKDSGGDPSGAATSKLELNYSAEEAARDLRFEKYSSPLIQDNIL